MEASRKPTGCAETEASTCIQQSAVADVPFSSSRNIGGPELVHNDSRVASSELDHAFSITSGIRPGVGVKFISDGSSIGCEDGKTVDSPDAAQPGYQGTIYNLVNQALHFPAEVWTDEKHGLYLNLMEAAFVNDLYRRKYCALDICGISPPAEVSSYASRWSSTISCFEKETVLTLSDCDSSNESPAHNPLKQKYKGKFLTSLKKDQHLYKSRRARQLQNINSKPETSRRQRLRNK